MNIYLYANILKCAHLCGQFSSYSLKILIRLDCRTLNQLLSLLRMLKGAWKSTKRKNFCFCETCFGSLGYRAPCYWKFSHCITTSFVHGTVFTVQQQKRCNSLCNSFQHNLKCLLTGLFSPKQQNQFIGNNKTCYPRAMNSAKAALSH